MDKFWSTRAIFHRPLVLGQSPITMSSPTRGSVGDSAAAPAPVPILHAPDTNLAQAPQPEPAVKQDHDFNDSSQGHVSSAVLPSASVSVAQEEIEAAEVTLTLPQKSSYRMTSSHRIAGPCFGYHRQFWCGLCIWRRNVIILNKC